MATANKYIIMFPFGQPCFGKSLAFGETTSYWDIQNPDDERTEGVTKYDSGQWHLLYARQCAKLLTCINLFNRTTTL